METLTETLTIENNASKFRITYLFCLIWGIVLLVTISLCAELKTNYDYDKRNLQNKFVINENAIKLNCTDNDKCRIHIECENHTLAETQTTNHCNCVSGYITSNNSDIYCNLKQKKKKIAIGLELSFSLIAVPGVGHWYVGRIGFGCIKFFTVGIGGMIIVCCLIWGIKIKKIFNSNDIITYYGICMMYIGMIIWTIFDVIKFAKGHYLDGHGYPLN